ncbi:MAG: radical SAM protein [archaeon]|nr:radical SAM protein [archaeon]
MTAFKKVPFLTCETSPRRKVKINLSGCNFNCKGCFAIAKRDIGRTLSVEGLLDLLIKSCRLIYGGLVEDVQMTGGEPTKDPDYLLSLIQGLRKLGVNKIGVSTNGYMLDKDLVEKLKSLSVDYIKLDLKAYTDEIHKLYTGKSNINVLRAVRLLHDYGLNFYVRTIFTPNIIDVSEIEKIAKFLSSIDKNILYRLFQFAPEQLDVKLSRKPTEEEMLRAFDVARKYLNNVEFFVYPENKISGYKTAYDPNYKIVEVRADELLENFKKIDEIAMSADRNWNIQYLTMNQVLSSVKEG